MSSRLIAIAGDGKNRLICDLSKPREERLIRKQTLNSMH